MGTPAAPRHLATREDDPHRRIYFAIGPAAAPRRKRDLAQLNTFDLV